MNEHRKRNVRRIEITALIICTVLLVAILGHNQNTGGSLLPTTIVLMSDSNGIPHFHGVSLANPYLRRALFRVFSLCDDEVTVIAPRGWMRNPVVKSNVWSVSEDINWLGLSPGARAIKQRNRMEAGQGQASAKQPGMAPGQWGMTLRQYPAADPQALADLESEVKDRQGKKATVNETTINLKPYVNCELTDPLADKSDQKEHTMEALPTGVRTYGGVPFDVQGIIQLNGPSVQTGVKLWPSAVEDITIGRTFKTLHLLHGAFNIVAPKSNLTFAKLILHYADGSREELGLDGGTHSLRCVDAWIPQALDMLPSPQTELAWLGTNPYLKQNNPSACLHIYRTTFDNPKPDKQVTAIGYVSTSFNPGPFMVGLTVE